MIHSAILHCCVALFRGHCVPSNFLEQPRVDSLSVGAESTQGINFLPHVSLFRQEFFLVLNDIYFSFILLQGLTGVAAGFLQIIALIIYYVKLFILGSTTRSIWTIKFIPGTVAWGTLFPNITLLVVISELLIRLYFLI